jgi:hypothetical protein
MWSNLSVLVCNLLYVPLETGPLCCAQPQHTERQPALHNSLQSMQNCVRLKHISEKDAMRPGRRRRQGHSAALGRQRAARQPALRAGASAARLRPGRAWAGAGPARLALAALPQPHCPRSPPLPPRVPQQCCSRWTVPECLKMRSPIALPDVHSWHFLLQV